MAILSLSTPAAQQEFTTKLDKLRADVNSVRDDIANVGFGLKSVPGLSSVSSSWATIDDQYKKGRWASRDTGTKIQTGLEALVTTELAFGAGVEEAPPEEVAPIMLGWISNNEEQLTEAQALIPKFTAIQDSLKKYKDQIQTFAAKQQDTLNSSNQQLLQLEAEAAPLRNQLNSLNSQAATIQARIDQINKELADLGAHPILPSNKRKKEELEKELKEQEQKLTELQPQISAAKAKVDEVEARVAPVKQTRDTAQANWDGIVKQKPTIDSITDTRVAAIIPQLKVFEDIQAAAISDVQQVADYWEGGKKAAVPVVLTVFNKESANTYSIVRNAFKDYAIKVGQ